MERLDAWLANQLAEAGLAGKIKTTTSKPEEPTILCAKCEKRVPLWNELEQYFASAEVKERVRQLQAASDLVLDNESKDRALVGDVISTVALAGQICREFNVSDHGIDSEIEFKDDHNEATGKKLYLKSGDSHLRTRKGDGAEIFDIKDERHFRFWMNQAFPVFLVIGNSEGQVRWMEIRDYLKRESDNGKKPVKHIVFTGERFDVMSVRRWRERVLNCQPDPAWRSRGRMSTKNLLSPDGDAVLMTKPMKHVAAILTLTLLAFVPAQAQRFSMGPFYGYRFGGDLENTATGVNYDIEDSPSYGVYFDIDPHDSGLKLELLWSYQSTTINLEGVTSPAENDLDVHVFQIGGIQELYDGSFRPFVGGYVGATWFDMPGLGDELRFSFTVAVGANYYFTDNLGLRLDARTFGTVVDSSGGFICSNGGCVVGFAGDFTWQAEVTGSIFLAF